jgi:hypothetical protein
MSPRTGRRRPRTATVLATVLGTVLATALGTAAATVAAAPATAAPACAPRPGWVDRTPAVASRPGPGLRAAVWRGPGRAGVPLTVAAVEADTTRYGFSVVTPRRLGQVVRATDLIASSGAPVGMNGDYYVRARAGTLPKGVEVRDRTVLYAPAGSTRAVGSDEQGRIVAGRVRVDGELQTFGTRVPIGAVNAVGPRAAAVTAFTAYGVRQPRQSAWYVLVRDHRVTVSSARHPGRLRAGDVLLGAKRRSSLAGVHEGDLATVRLGVRSVGTDRLLTDAIGSGNVILRDGAVVADCTSSFGRSRRPRSVVAWDNDRQKVWFVTVNARTEVGARGGTYGQMAAIARYLGADGAVLLDGGHSTTLTVRDGRRRTRIDARPGSAQRRIPDGVVLVPRRG